MNWKHLLYIIPITAVICFVIGFNVGAEVAVESIDVMEEFACQLCVDGMNLYTDMINYAIEYNGTTKDAFSSYLMENKDNVTSFFESYGIDMENVK